MPEHDPTDAPEYNPDHSTHDPMLINADCPECMAACNVTRTTERRKSKVERWGVEDKVVDSETK